MIATGATPVRPDLPGIDARGVHGVQHLGDGIDLRADVEATGDGPVVVVGAGYVGLELAEALHDRGPPGHDRRLPGRNRWTRSIPTWVRWSPTRSAASASS